MHGHEGLPAVTVCIQRFNVTRLVALGNALDELMAREDVRHLRDDLRIQRKESREVVFAQDVSPAD